MFREDDFKHKNIKQMRFAQKIWRPRRHSHDWRWSLSPLRGLVDGRVKTEWPPPFAGDGRLGPSNVRVARRSHGVEDPGENPRFRHLSGAGDGDVS
jgi:hypothetical protein